MQYSFMNLFQKFKTSILSFIETLEIKALDQCADAMRGLLYNQVI